MLVKVVLCDINPKMLQAWRATFEDNPEVELLHGSMTDVQTSAWVTPTNSAGRMDGGLDLVIKKFLGDEVERLVQKSIKARYGGAMPLGRTTCVPTGRLMPRYLISTPTMVGSNEDISDTLNVALACAAAFQAVHAQNELEPGSIRSVALPGLGANTGRVPVEICADLMWTAYNLFRERSFKDYSELRAALEEELGEFGPTHSKKAAATAAAGFAAAAAAASDLGSDDDGDEGDEGGADDEEALEDGDDEASDEDFDDA